MKANLSPFVIGTLLLGTLVAPLSVYAQGNETNHGQDTPADGRGDRARNVPPRAASGGAVTTGNGINYHNGPVLHTINLYYIFYGNWAQANLNPTGTTLFAAWGNSIGGSPYFNINTTYGDTTANVPNAVTLYPVSYTDPGSLGNSLSDSSIATLVSNAINSGQLGTAGVADPNGLYMVLTAPGVNETSGFLTQYCGWHSWGSWGATPVQYSFVGNAAGSSLGNCAWQTASSPNGDPGVDAMFSVMAHELEETATDPQGTGWYASNGEENGDLCAWTFGTTYAAPNGSLANMNLGGKNYLIQRNWVNAGGGYCALSYSATPDFAISATPSSRSVPQGTGTTYTATVTPSGGFSSSVALSVSGLPAGASSSFSPSSLTSGSSTLTVTTIASTPTGTFPLTITGTGGGLTRSASVSLIVTVPATPDFSISATPSSRSVTPGTGTTYTATVTPSGGFSSGVTLSVSGLPTGATSSFSPPSINSGSSTLTVTTSASTPLGTSTLTITGTGGGVTHSVSVSLTVAAPSDFGISVSPASITIKRGSSGSVNVSTTVTGAASSVALSLTGLPSRTSYSFAPSSVTSGGASTLKITINKPASTGTFSLTITGNNGTHSHSALLSLTIN